MADPRTLDVEIRSPDGPIFAGRATSVVAPGLQGLFGVLPRHASMTAAVDVGLTRVREPAGYERTIVTGSGFLEVHKDHLLMLVDFGDDPKEIDVERAKAARDRARARLRTREENLDRTRADSALRRAVMRLRAAGEPSL